MNWKYQVYIYKDSDQMNDFLQIIDEKNIISKMYNLYHWYRFNLYLQVI